MRDAVLALLVYGVRNGMGMRFGLLLFDPCDGKAFNDGKSIDHGFRG